MRSVQADTIPIDQNHDHRWCGEVIYLERSRDGSLWAVGHIADDIRPSLDVRVADKTVSVEHDLY